MFTVVAINRVTAYEIHIKDFFLRIPPDYIKWMQWINTQKVEFISERMQDITTTQQAIMNLNSEAKSYEVTQKSVNLTYQGMANLRLLNKVGDKTLM